MTSIQEHTGRRGVSLDKVSGLMPITETTKYPDESLARLRAEWGTVAPVQLQEGVKGWLVIGYTDLCELLRNDHIFSRHGPNWKAFADGQITTSSPYFTWSMPRENCVHKDGSERARLRAPLDEGFAGLDEQRLAAHVKETCEGLIGRLAVHGQADLMSDYAAVVPLLSVAGMLGVDPKTAQAMTTASRKIFASQAANEAAAALADLQTIITRHIENRRSFPADDLTTSYINNRHLSTEEEIREAISITVVGGYELTQSLIVHTLLLMLADKRFSGRVRGGRLSVDDAIEEVLWRDPPTHNAMPRFAKRDTILGGQFIRRGDCLMPSLYGANNDPVMSGGDPWNEVGNRAHLSWSTGRHRCPAQRSGRVIVATAVQAALDGLQDLALAVPPEQVPRLENSINAHYPTSLPVRFTPLSQLKRVGSDPGSHRAAERLSYR